MTTTTDYDTCEIDELDRLLAIVDDPRQALLLHHRRAERLGALDPPAAMEAAGDALKIAAGVSDRREHCHALIVAARYAVENDELERAARHLDRAASMLRHLPDPYPHDESRLHHYRGRLLMASGDYTAAMALHQRALELASERRDIEMMAAAEVAIGESRIQRGEYPAALEHLLAEVCRVLRPGGSFVFSVNVPEPAWSKIALYGIPSFFRSSHPLRYVKNSWRMLRYGAWLKREARRGRFHYLPAAEVADKLARAGFAAIIHRTSYAGQAEVFRCQAPDFSV